jgi:gliding motility associated protien GldN
MKVLRIFLGAVVITGFILSAYPQNVNTSLTPGTVQTMSAQQVPSTDIYKKETIIPEKKPVPYPYVREADVMWAKDIWRVIDLRQRMNFPLRYPLEGKMSGGDRYSLFGLLMEGILTEEITPYEFDPFIGWKDPFSKIASMNVIYSNTGAADSSQWVKDENGELQPDVKEEYIYQFQVQEQWFFDKKHSTMNVRIVALAPVWFELYEPSTGQKLPEPRRFIPFVVHFPQCRRLFATHSVYNANNDAQPISFDDLFFQRRFASSIMAESNVYGNRDVQSYKMGQDILLEAERIKYDLFIMEHDLWEY